MSSPSHGNLFHRARLALLAGLCLWLSGCVSCPQDSCARFEELRKETDYATQYRFSEDDSETSAQHFRPLPRGESALVPVYRMRLDPAKTKPCNHLTIHKEIYLQRGKNTSATLEEVREFYAADGTLIATRTESVGDQLRTSGYYFGSTLLPVPENAPPGKYRIVSKLILKTKNKTQATVLAKTSASFQVLGRK